MSTHFPPCDLPGWPQTCIYWAKHPKNVAIIFVHGFGGHAVGAWKHFSDMLVKSRMCDGVDITFYGYNSTKVRADLSASRLHDFLTQLCLNFEDVMLNSFLSLASRPNNFAYNKIIMAAHSLGGALCRKVVLECYRSNSPEVRVPELVLFAPAHKGADVLSLLQTTLSPFFLPALVKIFAHRLYPVLHDLDPSSPFLLQLEAETKARIHSLSGKNGASMTGLVAKRVMVALRM